MDKDIIRPIVVGSPSVNESETVVSLAREMVRIQVPGLLMAEIIRICNGQRSFGEVLDLLGDQWDRKTLEAFLNHLMNQGVLRDCCDMSGYIWPFVFNPSYFAQSVTNEQVSDMVEQACQRHRENLPSERLSVHGSQLVALLNSRQSSRVFSGQPVELQKIVDMLWAGYGILGGSYDSIGFDRHTVPSAGALYPLRISLALFQSSGDLESGVYDVAFSSDGSVGLVLVSRDLVPIYQAFADPLILRGATGVIVINGSFEITGAKYGNRALLYVPLEAGHVAQNIYLSAAESGVAIVEIGGFLEESMQEALHLPEGYLPLTTVVFGGAGEPLVSQETYQSAVEVRWVVPKAGGYTAPFVLVFARWKQGALEKDDWSCGRSKDPFIAHAKAVAEAEEWAACGFPKGLVRSRARDLPGVVSPEVLVAFHSEQYGLPHFPFFSFDPETEYEWKEAVDLVTGTQRFVLADCIYFPYHPEYPRYASANSSGVAAYPTRSGAIERAVLELIERDAFMIVWLNRLVMPTVQLESLPADVRERIERLEKVGFRVIVKDLTLDLAPVVLVFVQNEDLHYTNCSACSSFNPSEALDRALMEVESAVYCRLAFGSSEPILPEDVRMTQDHGKLYEQEAFFHRADFLREHMLLKNFGEVGAAYCFSWEGLLGILSEQQRSIFVVDLEVPEMDGKKQTLHKVKAFVTGLVSISFGYGEEPCGMQRIYDVPVALGFCSERLQYGELNTFPHPYT